METRFHDATSSDWFAVQVVARREHLTATHLSVRGYEVFLPCYTERRRWADRVKIVDRTLFPGYLFARAEANPERIVTAPGVIRIVGNSDGPICVAPWEMQAIQHVIDAGSRVEPCPVPRAGERVRIEEGPLRGVEGTVLFIKGGNRLVVTISLLQRSVSTEIDSAWSFVSSSSCSYLS